MNARADNNTQRRVECSDRLRMLLAQRGHALVPAQLARDFEFSSSRKIKPQAFSNWLNGVQTPRRTNLVALATWLNVTADFLAVGTPVLHFAPAKHPDIDTAQLCEHFAQLDAMGRRVALAQIASLVWLKGGAA